MIRQQRRDGIEKQARHLRRRVWEAHLAERAETPQDHYELVEPQLAAQVLARSLAVATSFGGKHFDSLAKRFRVSASAMALRLTEVGVVVR